MTARPLHSAIAALANDEEVPTRLASAAAKAQKAPSAEAHLEHALLAALEGRGADAELAVGDARRLASEQDRRQVELACALVMLEAGHPARAAGALERADAALLPADDFTDTAVAHALHARTLLLSDATSAAAEAASAAVFALPGGVDPPVEALVRLASAECFLSQPDNAAAEEQLGRAARLSVGGVLAVRGDQLLARLKLEAPAPQPAEARAALERALARLERLRAPREAGLALLAMASVSPEGESPASWLARAQPLLARAGTPKEVQALRRAFRAFGRREIDRVIDADLFTAMDRLRLRQARLRDVLSAERDARDLASRPWGQSPTEKLIDEAIDQVRSAEEELISALERAVIDRERTGQLLSVSQELSSVEHEDELESIIPRLAMALCPADCCELVLLLPDGTLELRNRRGTPLGRPRSGLAPRVAQAIKSGPSSEATGDELQSQREGAEAAPIGGLAILPVSRAGRDLALIVERAPPRLAFTPRELEHLAVLCSLSGSSLARASSGAALREVAARDAATLAAIRDGVLSTDSGGVVRAMNEAAARLLRVDRAQALGRRLRFLPQLEGLGAACEAGRVLTGEVMSLPHGDILVRTQPFEAGAVATIQELAAAQRLAQRIVGFTPRFTFEELLGQAPAFLECLRDAKRAAQSDVQILITGESGTGKEMLAQAVHNASPESGAPFVGINVAAIPRELLESELFGYERGAFTGARSGGNPGKFELAESGTVLLDEIGDMPLEMQAKLLRVLQERRVQRLGGTKEIPIRARVIATTHRDLEAAVADGAFRLDLFHRLRVVHLRLPPLGERKGDIRLLVEHSLSSYCQRLHRSPIRVAPEVMAALEAYHWPGNVRELANLIEGEASLLPTGSDLIDRVPASIARALSKPGPSRPQEASVLPFDEVERKAFAEALRHFEGNVAKAATALGVAKGTFYNKIRRYKLG